MDKSIDQKVESIFNEAVKQHTGNNLDEAKKLYQKVIEINPNYENA